MVADGKLGFATRQIHAGQAPAPGAGALALPIYQTTAYAFPTAERAAAYFDRSREGFIYSRTGNPTVAAVERRLASLEGGVGAILFASGQAAVAATVLTLAGPGDQIVASSKLYGGTTNLLADNLAARGIRVDFVEGPADLDAWRAAITPATRALYAESISNPNADVADIEGLAGIAHGAGVPLIVDNTLPTPYLTRPIEWGADIVVHSVSKFLSGHGTVIAGAVIDAGSFDYGAHPDRFANFAGQLRHFDGIELLRDYGRGGRLSPTGANVAFLVKARVEQLHDFGADAAPVTAFLIEQGLETLSLRIRQHVANAQAVAEWLEGHAGVAAVHYPGLASSPQHALARKYAPEGPGAVFSFEIRGGEAEAHRFIDALRLFTDAANIGDVRSLVIHPYSTTHSSITEAEKRASGVTPGLIRLSVGVEDLPDILADLQRGFDAIGFAA